ncbi:MAG: hypothetical protein ACP5TZ_02870 [Nitrososphaeria archaeon]
MSTALTYAEQQAARNENPELTTRIRKKVSHAVDELMIAAWETNKL